MIDAVQSRTAPIEWRRMSSDEPFLAALLPGPDGQPVVVANDRCTTVDDAPLLEVWACAKLDRGEVFALLADPHVRT